MEIALGICITLLLLSLLKIAALKKSAREISEQFRDRASLESNALIRISSRDRDMRDLATGVNESLHRMTQAYHKYYEGDAEMKASITNLAHDIRTPLTSICGYLSLMGRLDASEEMKRYLGIVSERADFMKRLTEELFAYSIVAGEEEEAPMERTLINRILEDSIMDYYGALTDKGIVPTVSITENRIERMVNVPHLERVFSNLISNALKYSDGDLDISLSDDGVITFANTASGLTPVQVEKLFNRFYTVHSARNATGLGLSIAKKFVEEMHGTITAGYEDTRLVITIVFPCL